jgi:hypothetical protein
VDSLKIKWAAVKKNSVGRKSLAFSGLLFLPLLMVSYIIRNINLQGG